jgi:hypothetical protein
MSKSRTIVKISTAIIVTYFTGAIMINAISNYTPHKTQEILTEQQSKLASDITSYSKKIIYGTQGSQKYVDSLKTAIAEKDSIDALLCATNKEIKQNTQNAIMWPNPIHYLFK